MFIASLPISSVIRAAISEGLFFIVISSASSWDFGNLSKTDLRRTKEFKLSGNELKHIQIRV